MHDVVFRHGFLPLSEASVPTLIKTIKLRTSAKVRDLIDLAAGLEHKSRSQFILDASAAAAQNALLDQTHFGLSSNQMAEFERIMDAPLTDNRSVSVLLASRAPWE